jgi:hypothetical protein
MKTNFKKIIFFTPLILVLLFFSCDFSNESVGVDQDFNKSLAKEGVSIGEQHNIMLAKLYNHLDSIQTIDSLNIDGHVLDFFNSNFTTDESNIAREYYFYYRNPNNDIFRDFTPNLKTEKDNLIQILDNAEFSNISEFRLALDNYSFLTTLNSDERLAWAVFTDVLYHSFDYWSQNLSNWEQLLNTQNVSLGDPVPCSERGSWFSRNWCRAKDYVIADASGSAGTIIFTLAFSNPVVFGGVVSAGLASSASKAIYNIVIDWF